MKTKQMILSILVVAGIGSAQINLEADDINFRSPNTADRYQDTEHNGRLRVHGQYADALISKIYCDGCSWYEDWIAVYGISEPTANYGIGVQGDGGYIGVRGNANVSGSGYRYGVRGSATASNTTKNYAGYFYARNSASNYGVYASSGWDDDNIDYGVYAKVYGSEDYAGYFDGNVFTTGNYLPSDGKLKKNVRDLTGSLAKVMQLKPKVYEYKLDNAEGLSLAAGERMGLIAQDVATVFPELVKEVQIPSVDDGKEKITKEASTIQALNYTELVPVLVTAIQEQQKEIEALKAQLK